MGNVVDTKTLIATGALVGLAALTAGAAAPAAAGVAAEGAAAGAGATGAAAGATGAAAAGTAATSAVGATSTAAASTAAANTVVTAAAEEATWKSTLATMLKAGGAGMTAGGALDEASAANALLKSQYLQDEYNSKMEKAQNELDLAVKEKETQQRLAATLATQNNMFGAVGINPANGGSAGKVMESTLTQGQEDERFIRSMQDISQTHYENSKAYRVQAYRAAKRNNSAKAGAAALGSLIQFGASMYGD